MSTAANFNHVSRDQLLLWCREHAPDLRIGYARAEDGTRKAFARFTWHPRGRANAQVEELQAADELSIARVVFIRIRELLGAPVSQGTRLLGLATLEQEILQARFRGDKDGAKALERELVQLRASHRA